MNTWKIMWLLRIDNIDLTFKKGLKLLNATHFSGFHTVTSILLKILKINWIRNSNKNFISCRNSSRCRNNYRNRIRKRNKKSKEAAIGPHKGTRAVTDLNRNRIWNSDWSNNGNRKRIRKVTLTLTGQLHVQEHISGTWTIIIRLILLN